MKKYTHEEFLQSYKEKQPEKSKKVKIIGRYVNDNTPIQCECKTCGHGKNGEWNPKPNKLKQGRGCPECGKKKKSRGKRGKNKKLQQSYEEFLKDLKKKNDKSKFFEVIEYIGEWNGVSKTDVRVKCLVDDCKNIWEINASELKKSGCPKCADRNKIKRLKLEFIEKLKCSKPNIELCGDYNGYSKDANFICNIHKYKWNATPREVIERKYGCRKCYDDSNRKTKEDIIKKIHEKEWDEELELLDLVVEDYKTYAIFKHKKCNKIIKKQPYDFLRNKDISCEYCKKDLDIVYNNMNNFPKSLLMNEYSNKFEVVGISDYKGGARFKFNIKCKECNQVFDRHYSSIENIKVEGSKLRCPYCNIHTGSNESRLAKYSKYIINKYLKNKSRFEVITPIEIDGKIYNLRPDILIDKPFKYHIEINGIGHKDESGSWATDQEKYQAKVEYFRKKQYTLVEIDTNSKFIQETYDADKEIKKILDKCDIQYDDYEVTRNNAIEFAINSSIENIEKDKDIIFDMYLNQGKTLKYIVNDTSYSAEVVLALFDKYNIEYTRNFNKIVIIKNGKFQVFNGKGDIDRNSDIPAGGISDYAYGKNSNTKHYYSKHNAYVYTLEIWNRLSEEEKFKIIDRSKLDNYLFIRNGVIEKFNTRREIQKKYNLYGVSDCANGNKNHYIKKYNIYIYTREKWELLSKKEQSIVVLKSKFPEYIIYQDGKVFGATTNAEMIDKFKLSSRCNATANGKNNHYHKSKNMYIIKKEKFFEYYIEGKISDCELNKLIKELQ